MKFPCVCGPRAACYRDPRVSVGLLTSLNLSPLLCLSLPERRGRKDDAASCRDRRTLRPFGRVPASAPYLCSASILTQHMRLSTELSAGLCLWRIFLCFSVTVRGLTADLVPSSVRSSGVRYFVNTQTNQGPVLMECLNQWQANGPTPLIHWSPFVRGACAQINFNNDVGSP